MGTDVGTVNADQRHLYLSVLAGLLQECFDHLLQDTAPLVVSEPMVDALARRVTVREIAPRGSGAEYPEDAIEHLAYLGRLSPARRRIGD